MMRHHRRSDIENCLDAMVSLFTAIVCIFVFMVTMIFLIKIVIAVGAWSWPL